MKKGVLMAIAVLVATMCLVGCSDDNNEAVTFTVYTAVTTVSRYNECIVGEGKVGSTELTAGHYIRWYEMTENEISAFQSNFSLSEQSWTEAQIREYLAEKGTKTADIDYFATNASTAMINSSDTIAYIILKL